MNKEQQLEEFWDNITQEQEGKLEQCFIDEREFGGVGITKDNCEVVFWLQNNVTKEIFYVNKLPFTEFQPGLADLNENEISNYDHNLTIFPNPCRNLEFVNVSFSLTNIMQSVELNIYNIKGQLVKTITQKPASKHVAFIWNGKDSMNKPVSSGIYLMEIKASSDNNMYRFHKKSLLIK